MAFINACRTQCAREREADQAIQRRMESRISYYVDHPAEIDRRLAELDAEWNVERALQTKAASISLAGVLLSVTVNRKWLILPAVAGGFLLQHAVQGWCPPYAVLRRMGCRTQREIEQERYALKALRGDFDRIETFKNKLTRIFGIVGISSR